MATEKNIIVALELGSTSIRAIAGQHMPDGTMQVLAFAEENASNCIRKGIIDNIDKTTQAISRVLGQIGLQLGQTVSRIYVGLGGQSLHSVQNKIQRTFAEKTQITNALIDQLMDTNRGVVYTDSQILEVIPQEYKVGNRAEADIVGMQIELMEANFLNIIARNSLADNIEKCVHDAGFEIAELLITPLSLGGTILNAAEKRSGCALVDIGSDTTTVSIYTKNILRKLVVIPMGSNNATIDLSTCLTTELEEAESLKLKYGRAWSENHDTAQNNIIKISLDREISESRLCEIIEARYEEILRNIWAQIEDDCDKLTSGIIFTGGGAQIRSITDAFMNYTNCSKPIRLVKGLPADICTISGVYIPDNGRANCILSMLLNGDQNCIAPGPTSDNTPTKPKDTDTDKALEPVPTPISIEQEEDTDNNGGIDTGKTPENEVSKKKKSFWQIIKDALTDDEDERN